MRRRAAGVAGLAAALLATTGALAAEGPAPDPAPARYEVDFLTDMIDHHAMAVDMAEGCVEEAIHDPLRLMCEEIIAAQQAEVEQLQAWLSDWYGVTHEPMMTPGMMAQTARLESLSGERFEITFMKTMIRHHSQAIVEAQRCLDRAWHDDLRAMCTDIIAAQSMEIERMQGWLCDWYDRCGYFGDRRAV